MAQKYQSKPLNKQKARRPWEPDVSNSFVASSSLHRPGSDFSSKARRCLRYISFRFPLCLWFRCAGSTSLIVVAPETLSATVGMDSCIKNNGGPSQSGESAYSSAGLAAGVANIWIPSHRPCSRLHLETTFLPRSARPRALSDQRCDSRAPVPARPASPYQNRHAFGVSGAASFPVCNFRFNWFLHTLLLGAINWC